MKASVKIMLIFLVLSGVIAVPLLAFDWPQEEAASDSFYSYFAQLRGGTLESSLIFKNDSDIKAADDGKVLAVISEHENSFGWFESTLGNAIIVSHDNDIVTVYGNLDRETIPQELTTSPTVEAGMYLGTSGNSGWQQGQSSLEFSVLDTQNKVTINPRVLMPRVGQELPLVMGSITAVSKQNTSYSLSQTRSLSSGTYRLYRDRQDVAVPYRTNISVNGVSLETIQYDSLREVDGKLCVHGNADYPLSEVYPDQKRQLLGEVFLSPGRNIITVTISDITNLPSGTKTASFTIDVR